MELINQLPIPALAFRQFDQAGNLDCVISAKATFRHVQDGVMALSPDQVPFLWADHYEGDPHKSALLRQSDLTPEKTGTDVTFLGSAHTFDDHPQTSWECSIAIGTIHKRLKVFGPRQWQPQFVEKTKGVFGKEVTRSLTGWRLSAPEFVREVPITWTLAAGGGVDGTPGPLVNGSQEAEPANPLGCGIVRNIGLLDAIPMPAPSVLSPEDGVLKWDKAYQPRGLGPIPPWWPQRSRYAGTYDDKWLDTRHPLLPLDFDPRFWQCAPEDQVAYPFLEAGTEYFLKNLHPQQPVARGFLPSVTLGVHCLTEDRDEWHLANLDGVHFDWRSDERIIVTWRARFPLPDAEAAKLTLANVMLETEDSVAT
jgi:hypothetical protein